MTTNKTKTTGDDWVCWGVQKSIPYAHAKNPLVPGYRVQMYSLTVITLFRFTKYLFKAEELGAPLYGVPYGHFLALC